MRAAITLFSVVILLLLLGPWAEAEQAEGNSLEEYSVEDNSVEAGDSNNSTSTFLDGLATHRRRCRG